MSFKNLSGRFSIWIATYNNEITLGLESPDGKTDIRTHVSCYEIEDLDDCFARSSKLINEILDNKVILYYNDSKVYDWIEYNNRLIEEENRKGITFRKFLWNESEKLR